MNTAAQFVALKKLTGKGIVRVATKHILREIQAEIGADSHIDHNRIGLNEILAGAATAADVAAHAESLMADAGLVVLRKDAVRGIEIVIGLPTVSTVNHAAFFSDALAWVREFFKVPVLSAVIHQDEAAPHIHVILLPLMDGRMVGSDLVGNKPRLQAIQAGFFERVGQPHGLTRSKAPRRLNPVTRSKCASMAYTAIVDNPDLLLRPDVERVLLALLVRDPEPMLGALGMTVPTTPAKPCKSFVEIMTKPCSLEKPAKPIGFVKHSKPIGFASEAPEKQRTLSCVGFASSPPTFPGNSTASGKDDYQRIRDDDRAESWDGTTTDDDLTRCRDDPPAEYWDSESGEYRMPPPPNSGHRSAGRAALNWQEIEI